MQIIHKVLFKAEKRGHTYTTHTATITTHKYDGTVLGNTIVVGGSYESCVHIGIRYINGRPAYGTLDRADSEVECSLSDNIREGDFANVLRASIQFAHLFFPTVNIFVFKDDSKIDCGISANTVPPRKRVQPFSLPHLSLSYTGMTWYERTLNAKMMNCINCVITADMIEALELRKENARHTAYRTAVEALYSEKTIPLTEFTTDSTQVSRLMPLYKASASWMEFFNVVPKAEKCDLLFNWLPRAINVILCNTFSGDDWYIDVRDIPPIKMEVIKYVSKEQRGGGRTRRRRASKLL